MKMKETIIKKIKEDIEYDICNCIKCNNNLVTNDDYPDLKDKPIVLINVKTHGKYTSINNIYGAICHKCGSKFTLETDDSDKGVFKYEAALVWNSNNDPDTLIAKQEAIIASAKIEIDRLKQIKDVRKKLIS